jgi:DNA-binding winged helix-turn-helix (wHTH) protein
MLSFGHEDAKMATDMHWVSEPAAMSFAFGPFRLRPTQRLLTQAGKPVQLGSRAFDILIALLERPGELVSKEELMTRVWPNTFVAAANLAVHIYALRRALGDGREGNRYVVNIPGRGYRFVAPVTVEKDVSSETAAPSAREHQMPANLAGPIERGATNDVLGQQPRMLTVVGLPGVGQTPVTLAVVGRLVGVHDSGVWLIDVASPKDP